MKYSFCLILLFCYLVPWQQKNASYKYYYSVFAKAEKLFNGSANEQTDSLALTYYKTIIQKVNLSPSTAELLYNCNERSGILLQGSAGDIQEPMRHFYNALLIHKNYNLADSLVFRLLLSIGNTHYYKGSFDSSLHYFKQGEKIIARYPGAGYAEDLYNSLGALYSEEGNFRQSIIYFSRALEIIRATRSEMKEAQFAMKANIAGSLRLSGQLDSAVKVYKQLLAEYKSSTPVLNNLARIYLDKDQPDSALFYMNLVDNMSSNYTLAYYNSLGLAYSQKKEFKKAGYYFDSASRFYSENFYKAKNSFYGTTLRYRGDMKMAEGRFDDALKDYQQSVVQLSLNFNDSDVFHNPDDFIGDFASYELFKALAAKANCLRILFEKNNNKPNIFQGAISAYTSAFALADYIKRSIDNDEARLFIADNVLSNYKKGIDLLMKRYDETKQGALLQTALEWISKSRATSLAITLKETAIKQNTGIPDTLLQQERGMKIQISRLKSTLEENTDSASRANVLSSITDTELRLHEVMNSYNNYPGYYRQKFVNDTLDVNSIRENLNDETAIICYYKGEKNLRAFVIRQNAIDIYNLKNDVALKKNTEEFVSGLHNQNIGNRDLSGYLYNYLIQPLESSLQNLHALIIVPDQPFINLPFEALQKPDRSYLVEQYSMIYQFALSFLTAPGQRKLENKIAFAPFASITKTTGGFSPLQASAGEIKAFSESEKVINVQATKNLFLTKATNTNIIHLATHAAVNNREPENSFIVFYPDSGNSSYKLYAHELASLNLSKTDLAFLSACETGTGRMSQSEGSLSLSRAFAAAGCKNVITSLWKAEDQATAFIAEKFYSYVAKGYSYSKALQQAKKDLLHDTSLSQYHQPQYWSHLVLIGAMEEKQPSHSLLPLVIFIFTLILAFLIWRSGISVHKK
ncbi:MAG: CHAT domain-containing protein [Ilyomonas sp.]